MRVLHLLAVPLLASMGVAAGVAQSGVAQSGAARSTQPLPQGQAPAALPNPFAAQPLPGTRIPQLNLRALNPNAKDGSAHGLSPRTLRLLNPFVYHPNVLIAQAAAAGEPRIAAAGNQRCYAIREYEFSRVAPESDATRLSGSSTCEPASQVHLKGATAPAR